ncbi:hypothetical protein SAMN05720606_10181 [Paenibacillus polysaccharolyticus]|uniref:Uncharacterized protein n=1 Tax=Paenibacillus polysaccharolyticus TaxID=582692 RepID=A0A1G5AS67_9BACL|nr:hypothetical protein [Paenibacillus polysaccharolyticus]SCX80722.1 hypothetical protein SAMN05720606_10181 [Paenibacillus polysaccharolyticus]
MGFFGNHINEMVVTEIIESESFKDFVLFVRSELNIEGTRDQYPIVPKDYQQGDGGYIVQDTFGALLFTSLFSEIIGIEIYVSSIVTRINDVFSHRIHRSHDMELISRIYVFNAIAHEYVHIQQFEQGKITAEIMEIQNQLNYAEREIEREAVRVAKELLIQYTGLEDSRLNQIINGNVDNDSARDLSDYLLEWENRDNY